MTFDEWYDTVVKYVTPADIYQWMFEAWEAGQQAERDRAPQTCEKHCERNAYQIEIRRLKALVGEPT
jgi:hypothetical protein